MREPATDIGVIRFANPIRPNNYEIQVQIQDCVDCCVASIAAPKRPPEDLFTMLSEALLVIPKTCGR
jgi:hypothetical protein